LLPLWTQALAALGYASRLVFIYRNPLEVAASIHRRNQIPARIGLQLWLYYNLRCLQDAESLGGIARVASFHALLDDPEGVAAVLAFILCHRRSTIKGPNLRTPRIGSALSQLTLVDPCVQSTLGNPFRP
jgi:hypothetical protein